MEGAILDVDRARGPARLVNDTRITTHASTNTVGIVEEPRDAIIIAVVERVDCSLINVRLPARPLAQMCQARAMAGSKRIQCRTLVSDIKPCALNSRRCVTQPLGRTHGSVDPLGRQDCAGCGGHIVDVNILSKGHGVRGSCELVVPRLVLARVVAPVEGEELDLT